MGGVCRSEACVRGAQEAVRMKWVVEVMVVVVVLLVLPATGQTQPPSSSSSTTCIQHKSCQGHRHYFYHNGHELPLVVESSKRVSHQIANHILKILLQNVLCYHSVHLRHQPDYDLINASAVLDRVTGCAPTRCKRVGMDSVPDTMINLETWMEAGFDKAPWVDTTRLLDAGPLGPYGRMGWFLPSWIVEEQWNNNITVDHWRALLVQSVARSFSWWGRHEWREACPHCEQLAYRSPRCTKSRKNCATLFAGVKGLDGGMLQHQIESLGLPVDVVWLGPALHSFVLTQTAARQRLLFFSWVPSRLTLAANFTRLSFPDQLRWALALSQEGLTNMEFQVNQFSKVVWYRVKAGAPEAYDLVSRMSLPQNTYYHLLEQARLHPHLDPPALACRWVRDHPHLWHTWLPFSMSARPKLYLAGLFPLSGDAWIQPGLIEGALLAIDLVNADNSTLPSHELALIVNDTKCQADVATNNFIKLMLMHDHSFKILGVLGPACSDAAEPIAALTRHFHTMMVSYGAEAASLSDRTKYPYFFRTIPQVNHHRTVYREFFKAMQWSKVGALAEGGQELPEYHLSLQDYLQQEGIAVVVTRKLLHNPLHAHLVQVFKELRDQNVRVIIADFFGTVARAVMCEAYKQRMTAHEGYVWFLPSWYAPDWWDVDFFNSPPSPSDPRPQEHVPCTTEELLYAIEGHMIVSKIFTDEEDLEVAGGITIRQYKKMYAERIGQAYVEESLFASFVYDAVWVFAKGLQKLLETHPAALDTLTEERTARAFRAAINQTHFQGVSGYIRFDGSDRLGAVQIQQYFHNETINIGSYVPSKSGTKGGLNIDRDKIRWLSPVGPGVDVMPSAIQTCGVEAFRAFLGVGCQMAIIIANVLGFVAFIIIAILLLIAIKCSYDAKVRATRERMRELGLLKSDSCGNLTLDEWEVPRKCVVLNRKLGEGAFGTVCGGEMLTEDKEWVAVAVKTLKSRPSTDEKLDFFTEVGIMKRFKHANIVPLLGVCTRSEPIYAIMEFQLHGDLKTYLLSRRNLIGQNIKEAEDMSSENLTQMAIDIASGLQYLHQLKYVHRDLACRNCLVHANKTVKISDFGMTRHINDSDYYRFSRKGMLPVRWMSPESLMDGIFTFKSDIWSFGVVVYEIVTFGSFPYQGLSNTQVLDYVKAGNRLALPDKCPVDLCSFIHWCMFYDRGFRPDLEDILDYLHFNRHFLVPCLDAPTSAVVMEDTDSLQMALPAGGAATHITPHPHHLHRRSGSWQDKLACAARKTFSVPSFGVRWQHGGAKGVQRGYFMVPSLQRGRSSSLGAMQRASAMEALLHGEEGELTRSASCLRQLSSVATSERGDSGERGDSDYFSDNSKELCQTITTV
ncbi:uncharacterized protein LOC143285448 [Babylonia areolata]|uniref:uncharacterized protein LOC143285448 n=1 Tax=Babylonia areolata TaxID=304850 RepID=UPI003FCFE008